MGEAKRRGPPAQRQAEGVAKRMERESLRAKELATIKATEAERESRKTPAERTKGRRIAVLLSATLGMALANNYRGKKC